MSLPRVLVPFVKLHPLTVGALHLAGADAVYVNTSGPEAYWATLRREWKRGGGFIVLEQDKVPEPGLLQQMWDCEQEWCTARVAMRERIDSAPYPSLSCTKFGRDLLAVYPDLLDDVGDLDLGLGKREWSRLDLAISGLLMGRGWQPHYHDGKVDHLHESEAVA